MYLAQQVRITKLLRYEQLADYLCLFNHRVPAVGCGQQVLAVANKV